MSKRKMSGRIVGERGWIMDRMPRMKVVLLIASWMVGMRRLVEVSMQG
jgi:hypothetical protein